MRLRLLVKMIKVDIILGVKVTTNIAITKKLYFESFCRFVTHALTLIPRKTYMYVFVHYLVSSILRPPGVVFRV